MYTRTTSPPSAYIRQLRNPVYSFFSSFPWAFLSLSQSSYFWPLGMVAPSRDSAALKCSSYTLAPLRSALCRKALLRLAPLRMASLRSALYRSGRGILWGVPAHDFGEEEHGDRRTSPRHRHGERGRLGGGARELLLYRG